MQDFSRDGWKHEAQEYFKALFHLVLFYPLQTLARRTYRVCQKMTQIVFVRTSSNLHQI